MGIGDPDPEKMDPDPGNKHFSKIYWSLKKKEFSNIFLATFHGITW